MKKEKGYATVNREYKDTIFRMIFSYIYTSISPLTTLICRCGICFMCRANIRNWLKTVLFIQRPL